MAYSRGERQLKPLRRAVGMRPRDVAKRTGYDRQQVWSWENNEKLMSPEAMYSVSQAIGCRMEDLYPWIWADSAE